MTRSALTVAALAAFPALARSAGIDPSGYAPVRDWVKRDARRAHAVVRVDAAGRPALILKHVARPIGPAGFDDVIAAQDRAARAMGDGPCRVPPILASDPQARVALMQHAPGETLQALCRNSTDHADHLRRAGQWLAAYHRSAPTEARRFQPRFMADHLGQLSDRIAAGQSRTAESARFLVLADRVRGMAPAFAGRPTVSAVKHGDALPRNILIGGGVTWGIDMAPASGAPVGFDIARLLGRYTQTLADLSALAPGEVVPEPAMAAFFDGYDLVRPDDPSVAYLLRVGILTDWMSMPPALSKMSLIEVLRFRRIRLIARNALG